jgi:gentisate 1,2-dioxygenase
MPSNPPHHRSGAALYYIISGTGTNTIEGKVDAKGPGSLIYEPFGLVHQWGNPSAPFTFLSFNIIEECRKHHYHEQDINRCIEKEQDGHDYLKSTWDDMTPHEKQMCAVRFIKEARGAYRYTTASRCVRANLPLRREQERLSQPHHFHE